MDLCLGAGCEKPCAGQHEAQAGDDAKDEKHRAPMKKAARRRLAAELAVNPRRRVAS